MVNNAGFIRDRMLVSMTEDDFDAVVAVHLKGSVALTKHACAYWRQQAKAGQPVTGRVVLTTSGAGLFGNAGQADDSSAKAGLAALAATVALEMQRYGVTANAMPVGGRHRMPADHRADGRPGGGVGPPGPGQRLARRGLAVRPRSRGG